MDLLMHSWSKKHKYSLRKQSKAKDKELDARGRPACCFHGQYQHQVFIKLQP